MEPDEGLPRAFARVRIDNACLGEDPTDRCSGGNLSGEQGFVDTEVPDRARSGVPPFALQSATDGQDDIDGGRVIDSSRLFRGPRARIERAVTLSEEPVTDLIERGASDAQRLAEGGDAGSVLGVGVEGDDLAADGRRQ